MHVPVDMPALAPMPVSVHEHVPGLALGLWLRMRLPQLVKAQNLETMINLIKPSCGLHQNHEPWKCCWASAAGFTAAVQPISPCRQ